MFPKPQFREYRNTFGCRRPPESARALRCRTQTARQSLIILTVIVIVIVKVIVIVIVIEIDHPTAAARASTPTHRANLPTEDGGEDNLLYRYSYIYIYIYIYIYTCIGMYIYIYYPCEDCLTQTFQAIADGPGNSTPEDSDSAGVEPSQIPNLSTSVCIHIYIYIYTHM